MDLHVTLAAGPGVRLASGGSTEEIVITGAHRLSGTQLYEQLSQRADGQHFLVAGVPVQELVAGVSPLTPGAVIVAGTSQCPDVSPSRPGTLFFLVRSGPDAGKTVPLVRGTCTIGRNGSDITLHDPLMSRRHALLTVTTEAVTLSDRNSANGVRVDGSRISESPVTTDSDIRIGSNRCALILADTPVGTPLAVDLSKPCPVRAVPPSEASRLLIASAFLPLVLGVVLAVTTGMWFFLAFSALSAVAGSVPLINARKTRRTFAGAVETAVAADSERRRRAAPDPAGLALAALRTGHPALAQPPPRSFDGHYLRLGTADQPANIEARPAPPGWRPPLIPEMPVLVPLTGEENGEPIGLDVRAPRGTLDRVANLILLQLSALGGAGEILCHGAASELPHSARFLPGVTLTSNPGHFAEMLATGRYSSVVVFGPEPSPPVPGARIYRFFPCQGQEDGRWTVDYFESEPVLRSPGGVLPFHPDYVRAGTFEMMARAFGAGSGSGAVPTAEASVPPVVALTELFAGDSPGILGKWRTASEGLCLRTIVGSSVAGPLSFDLIADGPHLLVAGTTGSGKSEFLRSLVLGLSLHHPPAELNFMFIDFKGGAGLGGLASLPHVTGMLTDLSPETVSRALVSLRAEVKRRESLFAAVHAADYGEYRGLNGTGLPRLVIVIDEFRMLSEEVPGAVNDLMRIAALGRSLGMHLVLATQRPQGAITSEIRANITASVVLRMQSAMEAQDLLGSAAASSIPVNRPGRGYLRIASGQPIEFQTATTTSPTGYPTSSIMSFAQFLSRGSPGGGTAGDDIGTAQTSPTLRDDVQSLVSAAGRAARALGSPPLRLPVLPPLPEALSRAAAVPADILQLGLLDIPERQAQRPLLWDPGQHSHLAFIGQHGSGRAVVCAAAEHLRCLPDRHLYLLDGDANLRSCRDAPQVGAYVTASDVRRAARVLQRLAELVVHRLNGGPESAEAAPGITVFITGWGRWASAFRNGRFGGAEESLQDIVRDGETAGVALVIAGERELIVSRFFSLLPNRLYLPLGASPEMLLSWPKLPAMDPVPGRALAQGRISPDAQAVAQLIMEQGELPDMPPAQRPFRVAALPHTLESSELSPRPSDGRTAHIPIGVGGDDLSPVHLSMPPRTAGLIVGGAGTGKSRTLDLIAVQAPRSLPCLRPGPEADPFSYWRRPEVAQQSAGSLLLVDDVDLLPREIQQQLAAMVAAGARAVFSATPSPSLVTNPALTAVRVNPLGIVLGPHSPADGEVFGLRLEVNGTPPPGRAVLVGMRRSTEIQLARHEPVRPDR
ncbi:FtsK/SpoIIIE domain-containing protein [Arthrobacter subterraneus]|uniref:FtsK/SpoIIIE domain-containing protein n=1 Tax=Arthrobacter subterraneus TaxID=335973 RepID=UPI000B80CB55|nr:FtsK/SpoIIIE domain-containing protein [Arthrobacter subterraneus]